MSAGLTWDAGLALPGALLLVIAGVLVAVAALRAGRPVTPLRLRLDQIREQVHGSRHVEEIVADVVKRKEGRALVVRLRALALRAGGWGTVRLASLVGLVVTLVIWAGAKFIFLASPLLASLIAAGVGVFVVQARLQSARRRRQLAFLEDLPAAVDLIVRVVQAGLPVTDAIGIAGREVKGPVGAEFSAIAHLVQLGVDLKRALHDAAERIQLIDFDCFVVSLVVQRETGGQLSEVLGNLSTIVRRRKDTRAKAKALTAEGRLTVKVVAALPVLTGGGLALISPSYMAPLVTEPGGRHMLLAAMACTLMGVAVVNRMTRMEL